MVTVGYDTSTGEPIREPGPPKISTSWRISHEGKEFLKQAYEDIKDAFETGGESYADSTAKAYSDAQMEKFPEGSNYDSAYNDFTVDISRIYDKIKSDRKNDEWRRASRDAASSGPIKIDTGDDDETGDDVRFSDSDVLKKMKENWPLLIKFLMSKEGRDTIRQGLKLPQFKGWNVGEFIRYTKDCVTQGKELDPEVWKENQLKENSDTKFKQGLIQFFAKLLQKAKKHQADGKSMNESAYSDGYTDGLTTGIENPRASSRHAQHTSEYDRGFSAGKAAAKNKPKEENEFDQMSTEDLKKMEADIQARREELFAQAEKLRGASYDYRPSKELTAISHEGIKLHGDLEKINRVLSKRKQGVTESLLKELTTHFTK
jgi:hypothetical protein